MKIPAFPEFRKIFIEDRTLVESYTNNFLPYSDFNFTSLWSWDTDNERMISELNGNLVILFTDYETRQPFLSFIGLNKLDDTANKLLLYAKGSNIVPILRLIPEESATGMRLSTLDVLEDRNNFDYIFSIPELVILEGSKSSKRRQYINRFAREHPDAQFEIKNLRDAEIQKQISSVCHVWQSRKKLVNVEYELRHEDEAIKRLFERVDFHNLILTTVTIDGVMCAFSIDEIVPNQYCMGHYWKADNTHAGIYDFLVQKISLYLKDQGILFWNFEQDLGIENLRRSKMSFSPVKFLKKYTVSLVKENKVIPI